MFGLDLIHQDRNFVRRPPTPAAFALIISFVLPGLASCSPPVASPWRPSFRFRHESSGQDRRHRALGDRARNGRWRWALRVF
jgi:hypothetical protein